METKNLTIGLLITLVIAIGAYFFPQVPAMVGAVTGQIFRQTVQFTQGFVVGNRATEIKSLIAANCTLNTMGPASIDASHAASTTKVYDCAVTNLDSTYKVIAQFSTSTATIVNGWSIQGAKASSTPGYAEVLISNFTGTARVPSATGVGSSTNIWAFKL